MPRKKSPIHPDELALWKRYSRSPSTKNRNALVLLHQGLVNRVADKLAQKVGARVEVSDLQADGAIGLMEAVKSFRISRGVLFTTFAPPRIRGAMLDGLRRRDEVSRLGRQHQRRIDAARDAVSTDKGRRATDAETAEHLGVSDDKLQDMLAAGDCAPHSLSVPVGVESESGRIVEAGGVIEDHRHAAPCQTTQQRDLLKLVTKSLSKPERILMILYYYENLTMKEIGQTLGLSESRVSQMHSSIVARLRETLQRRREEFVSVTP